MHRTTYHVEKMDCAAEEHLVRMRLAGLDGVRRLAFDLSARRLTVTHVGDAEAVTDALSGLGLGARQAGPTEPLTEEAAGVVSPPGEPEAAPAEERGPLRIALGINATFFVVEFTAGLLVLYDALHEPLTRAVCAWAGVPLPEVEVEERTRQLTRLFDAAGVVEGVRAGRLRPPEEAAAHVVAWHRDPDGEQLRPDVAAVDLLNVLRPTVAVSVFVTPVAQPPRRRPRRASRSPSRAARRCSKESGETDIALRAGARARGVHRAAALL